MSTGPRTSGGQGHRGRIPTTPACDFCERILKGPHIAANDLVVAFADNFPLSPGHVLIVPRRHEPDFFALTEAEQRAVLTLIPGVRNAIERSHQPAGYNVGFNVGKAGGQTIPHAHLHVIPRYAGDVLDPRGGIRWVIPDRAAYWIDSHE